MPSIILKKYSEPEFLQRNDIAQKDAASPFSYEEWIKRNVGISSDNADNQYQKYLLEWYSNKNESLTPESLRDDYVNLLKNLSYVFREDAEFRKFANIDFDDKVQLKLAVPQYVKKLKEIALYYRDKREAIRRAKMKYNMIGSLNAVERTFYEYILKAFSKRDYVLNVPTQSAWNAFPDLSSINTGFNIEIEELYDDTDYFDSRETGTYNYPLTSTNPLIYILEDILQNEWGVTDLENVPLSGRRMPLISNACVEDFTIALQSLQLANEKYIGTDKLWLSGGYYTNDTVMVNLGFDVGNNFFYWFSGEYFKEAPHPNFKPININDLEWVENGATASPIYSSSDLIFVDNNGTIEAAWLAKLSDFPVEDNMHVNIRDNKTFKYPYPGIGVSAEGLDWTGKLVQEEVQFDKTFFPNQTVKNNIEKELNRLYWLETDSVSTVRPISIHETTLISDGAFASKKFHLADRILTRPDTSDRVHDDKPDEVFDNEISVDWLYDFDRTQLAIGQGETNIYWPILTYNPTDDIPIVYREGDVIELNSIDMGAFTGATAGISIDKSDIIYRKESRCGRRVEAAWLRGTPLSSFNSCSVDVSATVVETSTSETRPNTNTVWSPARISNLIAWWDSRDVEYTAQGRIFKWRDKVQYHRMEPREKADTPSYDSTTEKVVFNQNAPKRERLVWINADFNIRTPWVIATAFKFDKSGISYGLVAGGGENILNITTTKDGKIRLASNRKTFDSSNTVSPGTWHYVIAVVDGVNSKLIVDGVETYGALGKSPALKSIRYGCIWNKNRVLEGAVRDLIVAEGAITQADEAKLKEYMVSIAKDVPTRATIDQADIEDEIKSYNVVRKSADIFAAKAGGFGSGAIQPGVMFKAEPEEYERFIWTYGGKSGRKQNLDSFEGFRGFKHDDTCPYKHIRPEDKISLDSPKLNNQWKKCECQAIQYSPMGHTGSTYRSLPVELGDYIIADTSYPTSVSLDDWRGFDGEPWNTSEDFGWFLLDSGQIDGDIGWGTGKWVTNSGKPFKIKPGVKYLYYRSGLKNECIDGVDERSSAPFFVGKQQNCECYWIDCSCSLQPCQPEWRTAVYRNGSWVDGGTKSTMRMIPGEHYVYFHKDKEDFGTLEKDGSITTDCLNTTNFLLAVDIPNAGPYWASGTFGQNKTTKWKGLMYAGEPASIQLQYLHVTRPDPSPLRLTDDLYLRYERNEDCASACFIWNQPLVWDISFEDTVWNKLEIDNCIKSDILTHIQRSDCKNCKKLNRRCPSCCAKIESCGCVIDKCFTTKAGVTATNVRSDLLLRTSFDFEPVFVNYYAQAAYTMPVEIIDTTMGLPPSGGRWVPEHIEIFASSLQPWSNLPALFEPFVADILSDDLYTKRESGFFTPSKVGFTNLILNNKEIKINTTLGRVASSTNVIISPDHYARGPYEVTYVDSSWMKYKGQCLGGEIKNACSYQEFVPYQTSYETLKRNNYGVEQQLDLISPWTGSKKNKFISDDRFPANIKGEYPVDCGPNSWFNNQPVFSGTMTQWKSDVYGNQYGLYKVLNDCDTIWERGSIGGTLWVRDLIGNVAQSTQVLSSVIDTYRSTSTVYDAITAGNIIDFDIFYDTLLIQVPQHIVFERLNMDFDDGLIYSIADQSCLFNTTSSMFAGTWLNETDKSITFAYLSGNIPYIHMLDIDKSKFHTLFDNTSDLTNWDVSFTTIERPRLAYNVENNTFNITFMALSAGNDVLVVSNFEFDDIYSLNSTAVKVIPMPTLSGKKLLNTAAYDDKLLMIFEEQTCPNKVFQVVIDN